VEEVFDHEPLDASLGLGAMVTVVVRNSLLEEAHHDGPLDSGLIAVTQYAAGPLSHFLAARRREPVYYQGSSAFHGLSVQYPRAWACLTALTEVFSGVVCRSQWVEIPWAATQGRRAPMRCQRWS
jgi:hypothetical protein